MSLAIIKQALDFGRLCAVHLSRLGTQSIEQVSPKWDKHFALLDQAQAALARLQEPEPGPYYHVTYWYPCSNPYSSAARWEPTTFVTDQHPFLWMEQWKLHAPDLHRVLTNWQHITKAEYDEFLRIRT